MTFETDMMSYDPDCSSGVWLIHRKYLVYDPLTFQKMKGPTHLHISQCGTTYIYLNVDEYLLTPSIPKQRFKLTISHKYGTI